MTYREALLQFQKDYWQCVLERCHWSVTEAARVSECNRTHIYAVLKRLRLKPPQKAVIDYPVAGWIPWRRANSQNNGSQSSSSEG
jgi:hypothetical protein